MGNCRRSFNLRFCAHLFLLSGVLVAADTPSEQDAGVSVEVIDDAITNSDPQESASQDPDNFDVGKFSLDSDGVPTVPYSALVALKEKHLKSKQSLENWKTAAELLVLSLLAFGYYMLSRLSPEEAAKFYPQALIGLYLKYVGEPVPDVLQHLERSGNEAARVVVCENLGYEERSNVVTKVEHNDGGGAMYMCSSKLGREAAKDAMDCMDRLPSDQVPNDAAIEVAFKNTRAGKCVGGQVCTSTAAAFFEKTEDGKYAVKIANAGGNMAVVIKRTPGSPYKVNPEDKSQIQDEAQHKGDTVHDSYKPVITTPGEKLIVEEGSLIMIADKNFWDATAEAGVEQTTNDIWAFACMNEDDFCASTMCNWIVDRQKSSGSVMIARLEDGSNWNEFPGQIVGFAEMANPSSLRTTQAEYKNRSSEFLELFGFAGPPPKNGEWYSFPPAGEHEAEVDGVGTEIELGEQMQDIDDIVDIEAQELADIDDIKMQTDAAAVKF